MLKANSQMVWLRLVACIGLAACFMILGHVIIMNSEEGADLTLTDSWVSEFAASDRFGWIIKLSITLYCLAIADVVILLVGGRAYHRTSPLITFVWLMVGTAMIGGLLLVVMYDMYQPGWFEHYFNLIRDLVTEPTRSEVAGGLHSTGFAIFVAGFLAASALKLFLEWREGLTNRLPVSTWFVALSLIILAWLLVMRDKSLLPGIPQRAMLVLVTMWLLRTAHGAVAGAPIHDAADSRTTQ